MLPEWFDVAQTAYWILGILSGGAFLGCMARVLVLSMHEEEEESRMDTMGTVIDIRTARNRELARSQAHGIDVVIRSGMDRGFGGR
jgi:hypothetical protein